MIVDGRHMAQEVIGTLQEKREQLPAVVRLGVLMGQGDEASASFVRMKERVADMLRVVVVRELLSPEARTKDALRALERLSNAAQGIIVQLPLPQNIDTEAVLASLPPQLDVDSINPNGSKVRAPVAEAVAEILSGAGVEVRGMRAVVVGAGRLVGAPCAKLLTDLGAMVEVVTESNGTLAQLKDADIVVSGAGTPGVIKPEMLKPGVVLIDAGTSEAGGRVQGDADPACAEVASVFTPVPGGVGPVAVAMIFKNLFTLLERR